ncbi:hypothetical protein NEOLEDRAFT_182911 [Neolentinus lepideus HHB14362 ss-1]|uniref:Uncharacterized protein n=1 Tax=Neolentinus lepideus HHB14362 ss-1 TaxID=1314782 RepID=A0A165TNV8_9AGAM|nr:hypothetical protein NEOLEDRAFT_182911 [Neolentinus lepideus HHB14362 ss-1]
MDTLLHMSSPLPPRRAALARMVGSGEFCIRSISFLFQRFSLNRLLRELPGRTRDRVSVLLTVVTDSGMLSLGETPQRQRQRQRTSRVTRIPARQTRGSDVDISGATRSPGSPTTDADKPVTRPLAPKSSLICGSPPTNTVTLPHPRSSVPARPSTPEEPYMVHVHTRRACLLLGRLKSSQFRVAQRDVSSSRESPTPRR